MQLLGTACHDPIEIHHWLVVSYPQLLGILNRYDDHEIIHVVWITHGSPTSLMTGDDTVTTHSAAFSTLCTSFARILVPQASILLIACLVGRIDTWSQLEDGRAGKIITFLNCSPTEQQDYHNLANDLAYHLPNHSVFATPDEQVAGELELRAVNPMREGFDELHELFLALDTDGDGQVDRKEWGHAVSKHHTSMAKFFGGSTLHEVGTFFNQIDHDHDEQIRWEDFVQEASLHTSMVPHTHVCLSTDRTEKVFKTDVKPLYPQKRNLEEGDQVEVEGEWDGTVVSTEETKVQVRPLQRHPFHYEYRSTKQVLYEFLYDPSSQESWSMMER